MAKYQRIVIGLCIMILIMVAVFMRSTSSRLNSSFSSYNFKPVKGSSHQHRPLSKSIAAASKASNSLKSIAGSSNKKPPIKPAASTPPKKPPVKTPKNAASTPPKKPPVNLPKNAVSTPPKNPPVKPPKNAASTPPKKPPVNLPKNAVSTPPKNPPVEPPKNAALTPPKNPPVEPPKNAALTPPKNPPVKPPKNAAFTPPKNPPVKPPKNAASTPPKNPPIKPPKNAASTPPKNPPVEPPKNAALTPPKNPPANPSKVAVLNPPKAAALNPPENLQNPTTPKKTKASTPLQRIAPHGKKFLIYRCVGGIGTSFCSGLGNRQIGIVASYLLANATGRTFGVIMTHPCNFTKFMIPNTYNWIIKPEEIAGLTSASLHVRNNRKFTSSLSSIDFNKKYPQDVVYILNNQEYHIQLLQNKLFRENLKWASGLPKQLIYRSILNNLFKLHPDLQKKKDAFFKMARPSPKSRVMCAQVRMGKNPTIPWDNRPMNSMKGVQNLWDFFDRRNKTDKVFVTSDSVEVIRSAKKRFGTRFVTTEGPILHIDKAYRGSACAGVEKLVLDQMILVDCDTLVISTSSFGRIPAFLNTKSEKYLFRGSKVISW